jgi:hypothetical protein
MRGEELQPNNGSGSGELTFSGLALTVLFIGMTLIALTVAATIYWPNQRHAVPWLLAFGATTYVLALGAILATLAMRRLRRRLLLLRFAIGCLLFALAIFPPILGSVAIAQALVQLVGNRWEGSDAMLGVMLWGLVAIPVFLLVRRLMAHMERLEAQDSIAGQGILPTPTDGNTQPPA